MTVTARRLRRRSWGGWHLNTETYALCMPRPGGFCYEVDLERCTTSAEVLDWIIQVTGKRWANDAVLAGLVRAVDDVLHPQAHLCSFGASRRLSGRAVRNLVDSWRSTP